uniref:Uncharacterized protein n=1 Tax=Rhizophora mucronata TaxID=61149 RepID=A0A2P2PCA7_RHIMU
MVLMVLVINKETCTTLMRRQHLNSNIRVRNFTRNEIIRYYIGI